MDKDVEKKDEKYVISRVRGSNFVSGKPYEKQFSWTVELVMTLEEAKKIEETSPTKITIYRLEEV